MARPTGKLRGSRRSLSESPAGRRAGDSLCTSSPHDHGLEVRDRLLVEAGLEVVGGASLYRLTRSADAGDVFNRLGRAGILVRRFAEEPTWLRRGLPAGESA
jgi:hypothetical protein